jgi:hypothetical protein
MRYNRKFINARFAIAMEALGVPHGETWDDETKRCIPGVYAIDYASVYGGYTIRKIANEGGAESTPFGSQRYKASEFVALLDGIINAMHIVKLRAN